MRSRVKSTLTLSEAIKGYLLGARARRLSQRTIESYLAILDRFQDYVGDPLLVQITGDDVRRFLDYLGSQPIATTSPIAKEPRMLSNKTLLNHHVALSSLWTWAVKEGIVKEHIVRAIDRPKPEKKAIEPFSESEVKAMLKASKRSRSYTRPGKAACTHARPTADRDKAILLLLLDTGIRASELCDLRIEDLNERTSTIKVFGKGSKERVLYISSRTHKALWRYLLQRRGAEPYEHLFVGRFGDPLTASGLYQLIRKLGKKAEIPNAYPHRFRHTFAINFLRNGGDVYTLQSYLGHASLDMVKEYLRISQVDLKRVHYRVSPVTNWNL